MIKTRFWFQLAADGCSVELAHTVLMPFLAVKEQLFKIALDDDGQIDLFVQEPPTFDITSMTLSVGLGYWRADDKTDWEECLAACQRAGWLTFEEEYQQTLAA